MIDTLLAVEGLDVERGGRRVLADLSLTLSRGDILLVTGRNGAGKSTLLRTLAGLLPPQAGTIRYGLADDETRGVETVHYLGYEDALKPTLTVGENLDFWASMLGGSSRGREHPQVAVRGASTEDAVAKALAAFGIARLASLPAAYLSAGQKRRAALARLLLSPRPIWLLDEPLIALDNATQASLGALMVAHATSGGAILLASHQALALPHKVLDLAAARGEDAALAVSRRDGAQSPFDTAEAGLPRKPE